MRISPPPVCALVLKLASVCGEQTVFRFGTSTTFCVSSGCCSVLTLICPIVERDAHVRSAENRAAVADNDRRIRSNRERRAVNHLHRARVRPLASESCRPPKQSLFRDENRFARRGANDAHVAFKRNDFRRVRRNFDVSFGANQLARYAHQLPPPIKSKNMMSSDDRVDRAFSDVPPVNIKFLIIFSIKTGFEQKPFTLNLLPSL
jgi:hypothetical protein